MKRTIALLLILLVGCSPRRDRTDSPGHITGQALGQTEEEYVMLIALDLSGSFKDRIAGEAFAFSTRVIDRYFRGRIGTSDKLVIAQLSGTDRSLLWEGTPIALRKEFPTADAFRDYLLGKGDPNGSRVYAGLHNAMGYVLSDPRVQSGGAKTAVFVLSDMMDSDNDKMTEGYMNHDVSELGWRGGVMGLYYVDQSQVLPWRHKLLAFGVKGRVESEIVGTPPLPSFD
jgi:hypothetical protein